MCMIFIFIQIKFDIDTNNDKLLKTSIWKHKKWEGNKSEKFIVTGSGQQRGAQVSNMLWRKNNLQYIYIYIYICCFQSHRELVFVELCAQAKEVDQEKTSVRWAFRFGPTQEGAEHLVPFIMSGTDMYIQELEKLANNSHELEEEEVVAA